MLYFWQIHHILLCPGVPVDEIVQTALYLWLLDLFLWLRLSTQSAALTLQNVTTWSIRDAPKWHVSISAHVSFAKSFAQSWSKNCIRCDATHSTFLIDVQELSGKREDLTDFIIEKNTLKRNNFLWFIANIWRHCIGHWYNSWYIAMQWLLYKKCTVMLDAACACMFKSRASSKYQSSNIFSFSETCFGDAGTWMSNNHPMFSFKH